MCYWHENDQHMSDEVKAFYEALAAGGVGLIIVESPSIDYPLGARWRERYRFDEDIYIPGMSELTAAIHKHGCPAFLQLWHDGPWQSPLFGGPPLFEGPPVGASPVNLDAMVDFHRDIPRELGIPEIEQIAEKFINAAVRAKKAGFDGIEINAGSSHLMHNFLSPFWNRRQDEYGGSVENRTRLLVHIVREVKNRNGQDFPVSVLINGIEIGQAVGIKNSDCLTSADALKIAKILEDAGADALHIRNHWLGYHPCGFFTDYLFYPEPLVPVKEFPEEYNWKDRGAAANVFLTAEMKKTVSIPIIIVGKLSPEDGEKILSEGKADFIAMTRRLQADPEMPKKLAAGRLGDIAPCTACATCLDQSIQMPRRCRINAAMGTNNYTIEKALRKKKVVVIGGGPAGMEAARVSALRGHNVTLFEKSSRLGGLIPLASLIKGVELENLPDLVKYLKTQIKKLGVKVELNTEVDAPEIEKIKPNAVIIAIGGTLKTPEIPGVYKHNVLTAPVLHQRVRPFLKIFGPKLLGWLTRYFLPVGKNVAVIGGGLHGCEVAEFLVKRHRKVTIIEKSDMIGEGMIDLRLALLMDWFKRKKVNIITGAESVEITGKGVVVSTRGGKVQTVLADSVIPTSKLAPDLGLFKRLKDKVPELYVIGDCKEPRMIVDAISDGYRTAERI